MKKLFTIIFCYCFLHNVAAQTTSGYFTLQYNQTLHDATAGNNPWSIGIGSQLFLFKSKVKLMTELTADLYLYDDKVGRLYSDGTYMDDVGGMINLFAGASYYFTKNAFVSVSGGPSLIHNIYFGIKPAIGFTSGNKKVFVKISCINIYNREVRMKEDFTSASISIGLRMF